MAMIKSAVVLLIALVSTCLACDAVAESLPSGELSLIPGLVVLGKDRGRDLNGVAAASLGIGRTFYDRIDLSLHAAYGETSARGQGGPDVDVMSLRLDTRYRLARNALDPFLVGGLHHSRYRFSGASNDNGMALSFGAGVQRVISDHISVAFDARGQFDLDESRFRPVATLGLRYVMNPRASAPRRPPAPEAAAPPTADPPAAVPPSPLALAPQAAQTPRLELVFEFEFDSKTLRRAHRDDLERMVRFMRRHPDATARLEGHTDDRGSRTYNQTLSEGRAHAVRDHLVAAGIDISRITTVGRGEQQPVASNDTEAGRQRNRRVVAITVGALNEE